jgi:hypothetical protein
MTLDCQACGACCVNLPSNAAEGFTSWVEIEEDAKLLGRADLVRKLVVRDAAGVAHLRVAARRAMPRVARRDRAAREVRRVRAAPARVPSRAAGRRVVPALSPRASARVISSRDRLT